jgi:hypothetical protein
MFWTFKFSFIVDILAFFGSSAVWAILTKKLGKFFQLSGHTILFKHTVYFALRLIYMYDIRGRFCIKIVCFLE